MSTETTTPTPAEVVAEDLRRYGAEILPGSLEKVAALWSNLGTMPADKRAEALAERLRPGGLGERWLNPEHKPAALENGAEASPLRRELSRYSGQLRPGAVDELTTRLAGSMAMKTPGQIAAAVSRFMGSRDADEFQGAHRDSRAPHEKRVADRIAEHFGAELSYHQAIARDRGFDLAGMTDSQLVMSVSRALRSNAVAAKYGVTDPIGADDPRLHGRVSPPSVGVRDADGRFARPPAKEPAKRPRSSF